MSEAPFATLSTPVTAIPILFGLVIGACGCLALIGAAYGLDLESLFPMIRGDINTGAPWLLFGVALFAFFRAQKRRDINNHKGAGEAPKLGPLSLLEKICFAGAGLGVLTLPYLFQLPVAEAWAIGGILVTGLLWWKLAR